MSSQSISHTPNKSFQRLFYLGLLGLFLFSIVLRLALALNRELDIDEFQHLHAAWMVSRHYVIYRDFWENHTPLFYYLLIPLFRFCREGAGLVIVARIIMSFSAFGILLMTYALARIDHDRKTSFLAVLMLSYMVIFVQKSIEVRPDQFLVTLWLASLWLSLRALSKKRTLKLIWAGFFLGLAFLFSPKALLPFAAMCFTFLVLSYLRKPRSGLPGFLKGFLNLQVFYVLGFLLPVAICIALLYHLGNLKAMLTFAILENLRYPDFQRPSYLLNLRNICFFLLAAAGLALHLRDFRKLTGSESRLVLLILSAFMLTVFLFVEAAPYSQSVLLFAPLLAIYAAEAFKKSLDGITLPQRADDNTARWAVRGPQLLFLTFTISAGLIIPGTMLWLKARPFSKTNADQFRRMEYVLRVTRQTDVVFDGESAYIFRPQAYFYSTLFRAIIWRIQLGQITQQIPESLIRTNCTVVIYDERVSMLPVPVQSFLKANYEPSAMPEVYLAKRPLAQK